MDLFNKKILSEKEAEIGALQENSQRLEKEISELEAQIKELKEEKKRELKLHQDVVDTMLGEVQAFISANRGKKLTYMDLETLLPLVDEVLEKHSILLKIGISHFYFEVFSSSKKKDFIVAYSKYVVDKLIELGLVDHATFESYEEKYRDDFISPHIIYQINTTYSAEDIRKKIILLNANTFEMEKVTFKKMNITNDVDSLALSFINTLSRRNKGF